MSAPFGAKTLPKALSAGSISVPQRRSGYLARATNAQAKHYMFATTNMKLLGAQFAMVKVYLNRHHPTPSLNTQFYVIIKHHNNVAGPQYIDRQHLILQRSDVFACD
ncbi:MAG: hypothetical protein JNM89_14275 [Hyphomicrobiaceae bacterium]|nr:hypothetical protein [Hyphomicrobiaceae bacterium]